MKRSSSKDLILVIIAVVFFTGLFALIVRAANTSDELHKRCTAAGGVIVPRADICVKKDAIIK